MQGMQKESRSGKLVPSEQNLIHPTARSTDIATGNQGLPAECAGKHGYQGLYGPRAILKSYHLGGFFLNIIATYFDKQLTLKAAMLQHETAIWGKFSSSEANSSSPNLPRHLS